jgi:hypothetical protein
MAISEPSAEEEKPRHHEENGVPKWLAIMGHLMAVLLVVLIVLGLTGVVVDALRDGTVGGTYRNQRYQFQKIESPIAYWMLVVIYAGFPCFALWALITETLPGLWKRIRN